MFSAPVPRALLWLTLVPVAGCAAGAAATAIRPKAESAAAARGAPTIAFLDSDAEPLIVDWRPEQRGDLEVAMKGGVAVLSVRPEGMRLLPDCKLDGSYGFLGMTTKQDVMRLENGDELEANLPFSAAGMAAKVGGGFERGSTIEIAMVLVGKIRTTWSRAAPSDLRGACDGATHFVRAASVGAFSMDTGTRAKVRTAVELFGGSAGGESESSEAVQKRDGDLRACESASPGAAAPPGQCGALLRLQLTAISTNAKVGAPAADGVDVPRHACPPNTVLIDGKCTAGAAAAHVCRSEDAEDCTHQCQSGNAQSCGAAGRLYASGRGVPRDDTRAASLFERGCSANDLASCAQWGWAKARGKGTEKDAAGGVAHLEKACEGGVPEACSFLGYMLRDGRDVARDVERAAKLLSFGCNGGDQKGCAQLGHMALIGVAMKRDPARAATLYKAACDGESATGCVTLAQMYAVGVGVPRDPPRAVVLAHRGCAIAPIVCSELGTLLEAGVGVARDEVRAVELYQRACDERSETTCAMLAAFHGGARAPSAEELGPAMTLWTESCESGFAPGCSWLGAMQVATGKRREGQVLLEKGCSLGHDWGCQKRKTLGAKR